MMVDSRTSSKRKIERILENRGKSVSIRFKNLNLMQTFLKI